MVALGLLTLLVALHGVQPSGFAQDAKPLELRRLGNEYCEYGLRRRPPHTWCICWGKIDTRIEVLPWDCETQAPKFQSRRKRDRNSEGLDGFLRSVHARDHFRRSLSARNDLFPQDLLKANPKTSRGKWQSLELPKKSKLLEKALTAMFQQIAESNNDVMDNVLTTKFLLLPYIHLDSAYGRSFSASRSMSALKSLLTDFGGAKIVRGVDDIWFNDFVFLRSKLLTLKDAIVSDLEELLQVLKDPPNIQGFVRRDIGRVNITSHFWDLIKKYQDASAVNQETISESSKLSKLGFERQDVHPEQVRVWDRTGLVLKLLKNAGNYSNMAKTLGKFIGDAMALDGPKIVSKPDSATKSSVCTDNQDATKISEKCTPKPEIQGPASTVSAVSNSSPNILSSPQELAENSSDSTKRAVTGNADTHPPKIGNSSLNDFKPENSSFENFTPEAKNYKPKPDIVGIRTKL